MFTLLFGDYTFPNQTFEVQDRSIDNDIQEGNIPRQHGSVIQMPYLKSRTLKITGMIHSSTVEASHTALLAMQKALLAGEGNFQYRSDRYIKCYTKKFSPAPKEGTDNSVMEVTIQMVAQNPFFYSAGISISDVQTPVKGTTLAFSINNQGDVFSEPIFKICATSGAFNDDALIINLTNNKSLRFRGTIASGMTIEIDAEKLTVKNNGVDGISNFEGDFITLDAGTNLFQYVGATCRFETEYKKRWY